MLLTQSWKKLIVQLESMCNPSSVSLVEGWTLHARSYF